MKLKTATETIVTLESPEKILGFHVTFHFIQSLECSGKLLSPVQFSQTSSFSFLCSVSTLVQSKRLQKSITNKQKSNREKYKHMQGHNKSIRETGYWFVHLENVPKWTIKIYFLYIWCISTDKTHFVGGKSHKMWSKAFSSCLLKKNQNKKTNEIKFNSQQKYIK